MPVSALSSLWEQVSYLPGRRYAPGAAVPPPTAAGQCRRGVWAEGGGNGRVARAYYAL